MSDGEHQPVIMIVDDTPDNLKLLETLLVERGYVVRLFPKGRLALNAALRNPPDLFLLDILMPEMDGFELCRRIKMEDRLQGIPVLFISALTDTVDMVHAFFAGGVDYVTKPFQPDVVHARIQTHLKIKELQNELETKNNQLEELVAERTLQLAQANRIKDGLLRIMTYELRTPANGVLGFGRLLADDLLPADQLTHFRSLFKQSCDRLASLIEDTTALVDLEKLSAHPVPIRSLRSLLADLQASLPDMTIQANLDGVAEPFFIRGNPDLLLRAMKTFAQLCRRFSLNQNQITFDAEQYDHRLRLFAQLDKLSLNADEAAIFFNLDSPVRAATAAEDLGLAPVLARDIVLAFGGRMNLVKGRDNQGLLEMVLLQDRDTTEPEARDQDAGQVSRAGGA
jgi:two-component system, sensor histidine kinase and response regulator